VKGVRRWQWPHCGLGKPSCFACKRLLQNPFWHGSSCHDWRKERVRARLTKRMLTDELWERIALSFPKHPPSPKGGRPHAHDRECLEGILWLIRTGSRWQDISVDLPSGSTCWRRLQEWAGVDVLAEIHALLI
jgi:Putative transposase of IS4/5 family (DUF4096)